MGLNTDEQISLLLEKTNVDWNSFDDGKKYGRFIYKVERDFVTEIANGQEISYKRSRFEANNGFDLTIPENREKLKNICIILKENSDE